MNHQIDQLKEEISTKETALVKEHLDHQRVEKDKEALKTELTRMKQSAAESRAHLEALEMEERKLLKIISEADAERLRQKKELDQVMMTTTTTTIMIIDDDDNDNDDDNNSSNNHNSTQRAQTSPVKAVACRPVEAVVTEYIV